jgi:hypothetical protein
MQLKPSMIGLLALLALSWATAQVTPSAKKSASTVGDLFLEPSSTSVSGEKVSLRVGVLTRQAETFIGDYQLKVVPLFFKSEKGSLSMVVSDETLRKLASGMAVDFTGQATTSGSGKTRRIDGEATPSGHGRGTVKLRFMAGNREMVFSTSYHFDESREEPH